ncbi:DUF484 family protein [Bordetella sp. FB-8]|uniref:DUF484 family protein n=1 Tax=Bordetella sp. FB-8 TaxID=1159870 RepID=UPI000367325D|nr:DUF484 family protein [Bordetella sp. FB-8]
MTHSAQDIADFLAQYPAFFEEHADVFTALRVPHPHSGQTVSLAERQIFTLRERNRELEWRINELARNAAANETIADRLAQWCAGLVSQTNPQHLPGAITLGLAEQFKIEHAALRLWNLPGLAADSGYAAGVSEDLRTFADSLKAPYCGNDTGFEAVSWLDAKPQSLALIALRPAEDPSSIGLLLLGSDDPARFDPDMGTMFLDTIARLSCAALKRLAGPAAG